MYRILLIPMIPFIILLKIVNLIYTRISANEFEHGNFDEKDNLHL